MALDPEEERAAQERAERVRIAVGHPQERWDALAARIQDHGIRDFAEVSGDWLDLMWCLDMYRRRQAPPEGMGKEGKAWDKRLEGAYRGKGNWFATVLSLLLDKPDWRDDSCPRGD